MYIPQMRFAWDPQKAKLNRQKHGIAFADVPGMFEHPMLTFLDERLDYGEDRWIGIGWLGPILAVVVFTETDETIRVISARKATQPERDLYARQIHL